MGCRRFDAKRDLNEPEIVAALQKIGATVERLSGKNIPDLLIGYKKHNYLFEIKSKSGILTPGQIDFHKNWKGHINVIRNIDEALNVLYYK